MRIEQAIKDRALALGFDAVGITDAAPIDPEDVAHLEAWLASGRAGQMAYLHNHVEKRIDLALILLKKGFQSRTFFGTDNRFFTFIAPVHFIQQRHFFKITRCF